MAEQPRSRGIFYVLSIVLALILLEVGSWGVIRVARLMKVSFTPSANAAREIHKRDGVDYRELSRELESLYEDRVVLQPYRWYALPENFHTQYINTDSNGFRIGPPVRGRLPLIGMYGGSTMFSVSTRDEQSIPAFLATSVRPESAQVKNYGIGGYSSSSELMLFVETARYNPLSVAVFYDGVNEVGRYLEKVQDGASEKYYDVLGYPFPSSYLAAARRTLHENTWFYEPFTFKLAKSVLRQLPSYASNVNFIIDRDNVEKYADQVIDIYINNVEDIAALADKRSVVPVFIWQPNIYTTRKPLSDDEKRLLTQQPAARLLSEAVHRKIAANETLKKYHFFDLSNALDAMDASTYFSDDVHVSFEANKVIASRIAEVLKPLTPTVYWAEPMPSPHSNVLPTDR